MISDSLYTTLMKKAEEANHIISSNGAFRLATRYCSASYAVDQITQWVHLADAVDQGTVSPMEAYDAVSLGYLPKHLKIRKSRYSHLL